jgi:hypothetical protein
MERELLEVGRKALLRAGFVRLLTAGCFCAYLVAASPHLVHHAFEKDHGRPSCPFLLASQQGTSDPPHNPPPLAVLSYSGILEVRNPMDSASSLSVSRLHPRAPPGPTVIV